MTVMKAIIFSYSILALTASTLLAQSSFQIKDPNGIDVTGQIYMATHNSSGTLYEAGIFEVLNNGASKNVGMRRYETQVIANTKNYFCWSLCYLPKFAGVKPVWEDPNTVPISANSSVSLLHAYYDTQGISGLSIFRYVVFDEANPTDSAFVDIHFDITTSISAVNHLKAGIELYPNPASGKVFVNVNTIQNISSSVLVIRNMLGEVVKTSELNVANSKDAVNIENLNAGIYFYNVLINGKATEAKRLVIK